MIYLDSAAVVKLVRADPESRALRGWLDDRSEIGWLSSVLVEVESFRALARHAPGATARLPVVLDAIDLVGLTAPIRARAIQPATVRSLNAIHLATALADRTRLTSFVTYDRRLASAATAAGLPVAMPSA